jgi:FKBP-type peptidyl-prolyl cis-trans isomerase (trigger factor)
MPNKKTKDKKSQKTNSSKESESKAQTKQSQQQATQNLEELVTDDTQLEIKVAWKKAKPVYQKHLKQQAAQLKLKGFRKGKVPPAIAEKEIGVEKIVNLTLQDLLPAEYSKAIKDGKHQPLTHPEFQPISINKDNDWVLKAYFSEKPELKLTGYKKTAKQAKKQAEKDLEKAQKEAQKEAEKKKKEAASKKKSAKDKKNQAESKKTSKKAAEPKATEPKADEKMTESQKKDAIAQKIVSELVEELKPTVPRLLIRQSAQREMENLINRLKSLNIDLDTFLKSRQMTQEQLSYQMTHSSLRQLQVELLFQAIVEKEELKITQKEVDEFISKNEDEEARKKMTQDKSYQQYLESVLLKQKVIDSLLAL